MGKVPEFYNQDLIFTYSESRNFAFKICVDSKSGHPVPRFRLLLKRGHYQSYETFVYHLMIL